MAHAITRNVGKMAAAEAGSGPEPGRHLHLHQRKVFRRPLKLPHCPAFRRDHVKGCPHGGFGPVNGVTINLLPERTRPRDWTTAVSMTVIAAPVYGRARALYGPGT